MPEIRGAQEVNENGWQNVAVWDGQQTTGDYTVGEEYCAYYELPGTTWRAEHTFYVTARGNLNGEWRDLEPGQDLEEAEGVRYGVEERSEVFALRDGENQGDGEVDYGDGSYMDYEDLEAANKEAERMALMNYDFAFADKSYFIEKYPETVNKDKEEVR